MGTSTQTKRKKSDLAEILEAFEELEKEHGFVTRANFGHCSSCAGSKLESEIGVDNFRSIVNWCSWHSQNHKSAFGSTKGTALVDDLYIHWQGNAELIVKTLEKHGFTVKWSGLEEDAIFVLPGRITN